MADLSTLDATLPADGDPASQGASRIREERTAILTSFGLEHNLAGTHKTFYARAARSTIQVIVNGGGEAISFDGAPINNGGLWSAGSPTRVTVPAGGGGTYHLGAQVQWDIGSGTIRGISLLKNSAGIFSTFAYLGASGVVTSFEYLITLIAGDYLEVFGTHNAGAPVSTITPSNLFFFVNRVGAA